MHPSIT
jgi:hypothetical protein